MNILYKYEAQNKIKKLTKAVSYSFPLRVLHFQILVVRTECCGDLHTVENCYDTNLTW